MQKIVTHLWFDDQAEEAAKLYTSIFKNSRIVNLARYGDAGAEITGRQTGSVMTVTFELDGQEFYALNGGPVFKFNEAISLCVTPAGYRRARTARAREAGRIPPASRCRE
jgi:predicted 3-demethylubiquinone-9 3-methyltransferase (glyoxalase superfamily)